MIGAGQAGQEDRAERAEHEPEQQAGQAAASGLLLSLRRASGWRHAESSSAPAASGECSGEVGAQPPPRVTSRRSPRLRVFVDPQPESVPDVVIHVDVVLDTGGVERPRERLDPLGRDPAVELAERAVHLVAELREPGRIVDQAAVEDRRRLVLGPVEAEAERHAAAEAPADGADAAGHVGPCLQPGHGGVEIVDHPRLVRPVRPA